jgi:hypothetical protein
LTEADDAQTIFWLELGEQGLEHGCPGIGGRAGAERAFDNQHQMHRLAWPSLRIDGAVERDERHRPGSIVEARRHR